MVLVSYKNELYQKDDTIFEIKIFQDLRQKKSFLDQFKGQSDNEEEIIVVPDTLTPAGLYCIKCYLKFNELRLSLKYTPQVLVSIWKSNNFPTFDHSDEFKLFELNNKIKTLELKINRLRLNLKKIKREFVESNGYSSASSDSDSQIYHSISYYSTFRDIFEITLYKKSNFDNSKIIIDIQPKVNIYKKMYDLVMLEYMQHRINICSNCSVDRAFTCSSHKKIHRSQLTRDYDNNQKKYKLRINALIHSKLNDYIKLYGEFKYIAMSNQQLLNKIDIMERDLKQLITKCCLYIK